MRKGVVLQRLKKYPQFSGSPFKLHDLKLGPQDGAALEFVLLTDPQDNFPVLVVLRYCAHQILKTVVFWATAEAQQCSEWIHEMCGLNTHTAADSGKVKRVDITHA